MNDRSGLVKNEIVNRICLHLVRFLDILISYCAGHKLNEEFFIIAIDSDHAESFREKRLTNSSNE
jgi:hypothetical protein